MSDGYDSCLLSCKPCEGCGQHIPKTRTYCEKCAPDATAGDGLREAIARGFAPNLWDELLPRHRDRLYAKADAILALPALRRALDPS